MRQDRALTIIYVATLRLPTQKTYGINVAKTCEALANSGARVKLLAPQYRDRYEVGRDIFSYYGIRKNFEFVLLPFPDFVERLLSLGFWLREKKLSRRIVFSQILFRAAFLLDQSLFILGLTFSQSLGPKDSVIYTRNLGVASLLRLRRKKVFYDMHGFPTWGYFFWRIILTLVSGITVTNNWKSKQCQDVLKIPVKKILVAPNGFDAAAFEAGHDQASNAAELPSGKPIVMYTGHLYDWKGADVLAQSAALVTDALFVFVGGTEDDLSSFNKKYGMHKNILLLGHHSHTQIPSFLAGASLLVLPNPGWSKSKELAHYATFDTSPIKAFEYMASGKPIVATNLPSVREYLNEGNALLVEANNPEALAEGIKELLEDKTKAKRLAEQAKIDVLPFSWKKRGENILKFIDTIQ